MTPIQLKHLPLILQLIVGLWLAPVAAQSKMEKSGVTMYWGLVPAEVVAKSHPIESLHGGPPSTGGQLHHLVVALFDSSTGKRIGDAVVRAQLSESGIIDEPPKYLVPMKVNDLASYGKVFSTAKEGPYRFRLWVRLPQRQDDLEFLISAWSPHRTER